MKAKAIRVLLCVFPSKWRQQYGNELASILACRPLTLPVVADVARSGLMQRLRYAQAWQIAGIAMAAWLIAGTILNSIKPMSPWAYDRFWQVEMWVEIAIGYSCVSRNGMTVLRASVAAGKAALIGIVPELILMLFWVANLVHPTILGMNGPPTVKGYGITDLCIRSEVASPRDLLLAPFFVAIPGMILGALGGWLAFLVSNCRMFVSSFRDSFRGITK